MAEVENRLEVTNARVFDYRREVVVELHGRTDGGEFEVVSYALTPASGDDDRLRSADAVEPSHEDRVRDALDEAGYELD